MFITKKKLKAVILEAFTGEGEKDEKTIRALKEEIADLRHEKKLEMEDIKHLNRLAQEKREIELEKEKIKLEQEYAQKANDSLTSFHKKLEERFEAEKKEINEVYKEIIKRLPDVSLRMIDKRES